MEQGICATMAYLSGRGSDRTRQWGERIKAARAARGWTQTQLGTAVGMTANNISRVELGKYETPAKTRRRFAEVLGIPHHELGLALSPATTRQVEAPGRYLARDAAIAIFREQSQSRLLPRDPALVDRAVGCVELITLESEGDPPIAWWVEALEETSVDLRRADRALDQDTARRAKAEDRDRTIGAQDAAAMRPRLPKR